MLCTLSAIWTLQTAFNEKTVILGLQLPVDLPFSLSRLLFEQGIRLNLNSRFGAPWRPRRIAQRGLVAITIPSIRHPASAFNLRYPCGRPQLAVLHIWSSTAWASLAKPLRLSVSLLPAMSANVARYVVLVGITVQTVCVMPSRAGTHPHHKNCCRSRGG